MSFVKNFLSVWAVFLFVFGVRFWFLCGVSGSVSAWASALLMLSKATFNVAESDVLGTTLVHC